MAMSHKKIVERIGRLCNAWVNGVVTSEEAMGEIYDLVIGEAWEKFKRSQPEKAKEIEEWEGGV